MTLRVVLAAAIGCLFFVNGPVVAQMVSLPAADAPSDSMCQAVGLALSDATDELKKQIAVINADGATTSNEIALAVLQAEFDEADALWPDLYMIYVDGAADADQDDIDWANAQDIDMLLEIGHACMA